MTLKNKYFRVNGDELLCSKILLILYSFNIFIESPMKRLFRNNKKNMSIIYFFDNNYIHESQKAYSDDLLNTYGLFEMTIEELIEYDKTYTR